MDLQDWLVERIARHSGVTPDDVSLDLTLDDYGFSSRDAVSLSGELEEFLGRAVPHMVLWEFPTVRQLAAFLAAEVAAPGASRTEARELTMAPGRPARVAVIGAGCRLPGGVADPEGFWKFLLAGGDGICPVPEDRWETYRTHSPQAAEMVSGTTHLGGFIDDVFGFDAEFFGISPREAALMDPQQRLILEVAWEALEHAGLPAEGLNGTRTGVFIGAANDDYGRRHLEDLSSLEAWSGTGAALSIIANRLSYTLDLHGPSLTVDTACSSSLVALHLATRSLVAGECDLAVVGGVNLLLSPAVTAVFDSAGVTAKDGRCRPFDASAAGIGRSEGAVVLVLRRTGDIASGDRVLALVQGTAVNQDGRSNGLMAPNPVAQIDLLRTCYAAAGIAPAAVQYVEAHGTGTPVGDLIEASALGSVLGRGRSPERFLRIGSVKSNIGHLEAAAGLAGVLKVLLSMKYGMIPATLHFAQPNPQIKFAELGLTVVKEATSWPDSRDSWLAGISSFGFGGTNAHAILSTT